jgi:hypothetical protein
VIAYQLSGDGESGETLVGALNKAIFFGNVDKRNGAPFSEETGVEYGNRNEQDYGVLLYDGIVTTEAVNNLVNAADGAISRGIVAGIEALSARDPRNEDGGEGGDEEVEGPQDPTLGVTGQPTDVVTAPAAAQLIAGDEMLSQGLRTFFNGAEDNNLPGFYQSFEDLNQAKSGIVADIAGGVGSPDYGLAFEIRRNSDMLIDQFETAAAPSDRGLEIGRTGGQEGDMTLGGYGFQTGNPADYPAVAQSFVTMTNSGKQAPNVFFNDTNGNPTEFYAQFNNGKEMFMAAASGDGMMPDNGGTGGENFNTDIIINNPVSNGISTLAANGSGSFMPSMNEAA